MTIGTYRYLISKSLNGITLHEVQNHQNKIFWQKAKKISTKLSSTNRDFPCFLLHMFT